MADHHIVVVGAGVIGLTTALLLSKKAKYKVTVVAKHMPGDYDIDYASPWAGANYLPVAAPGSTGTEQEKNTWPELAKLAKDQPEAGIHFQDAVRYDRAQDIENPPPGSRTKDRFEADSWLNEVVPNFRHLRTDELPAGYVSGITFTSVCIDTAIYLPWLKSQCLANGVTFRRTTISHITDAARPTITSALSSETTVDVVVNCTGLSARSLGGVMDTDVIPARGQIVLVRNISDKMRFSTGTEDGVEEVCYMMTRPAGGGTILGGSYQKHTWSPSTPDPSLAVRIMTRCVALNPSLTNGKGIEHLEVIRHGVGLRPIRLGGTRLEKEKILPPAAAETQNNEKETGGKEDGVWVVHNYGHGGYGYQASYGCAMDAVGMVDKVLSGKMDSK